MRREGSYLFVLAILVCSLLTFVSTSLADPETDPNCSPELILPADSTVDLCAAEEFCFDVGGVDPNSYDQLTLTLVSGPIDFTTTTFGYLFDTSVCFTPDVSGEYKFVWKLQDTQNHIVIDSVTYTVILSPPPTIEDQYFVGELCSWETERVLVVDADNPGAGSLIFELLSGPGTIDPTYGILTYSPDTAGLYTFSVKVSNLCGEATATIQDSVYINLPPELPLRDTTIYLCVPQEVCFDVIAFDAEGTQVTIEQIEGPGVFTTVSDTSGYTCFTPDHLGTKTYRFVYCLKDICPAGPMFAAEGVLCPICVLEPIDVTVVINQPPQIVCPDLFEGFTCLVNTFCFDVDANDADFDPITFSILSDNATINDGTVCFEAAEYDEFDIVIEAADTCGITDTCIVPVVIAGNRPPVASTALDFSVAPCGPETICVSATADDPDYNIASITANYGTFDDLSDRICFEADTSGVYLISLTVTDSCGASHMASTLVTVDMNDAPVVDLGEGFDRLMCGPGEICIDVTITDDNIDQIIPNVGIYNPNDGLLCVPFETAGSHLISMTVVDLCGETATDEIIVNISFSAEPFVQLGDDFSVAFCETEPICVDVTTIVEYETLVTSFGEFNSDSTQICFTPQGSGDYEIIVTVTDSCSLEAVDTIVVTVALNSAPVVTGLADTSVYLCAPDYVCVPFAVSDIDGNLTTVVPSRGVYENGEVCFVPYGAGDYSIELTATDDCSAVASWTTVVHVSTDQAIDLICPNDTTVFTCDVDTFCFEVAGIPDRGEVSVSGLGAWWNDESNTICFVAECGVTNDLQVSVTTECGVYSCSFSVTVDCNTPPQVVLPQDYEYFSCEPGEVCFPVAVNDLDDNLDSVTVSGGTYDVSTGHLCFMADTAGVYDLRVTAYDSCGTVGYDQVFVTVVLNSVPSCGVPNDTT
ncbi:MAG: hypothetical protein KAT79_03055, partial [candidate division Zixibacteria bacterium]|nr:hypothetical protein [candidate division Zixibacteria bacterium]